MIAGTILARRLWQKAMGLACIVVYLLPDQALCQALEDPLVQAGLELVSVAPAMDAELYLSRPSHMSACGRFTYVSENSVHAIHAFRDDGATYSHDKQGEGPGELQNPNHIECGDGVVYLLNGGVDRVLVFSEDLTFRSMFRIPGLSAGDFMILPAGLLMNDTRSTSPNLIALFDFDGKLIRSFGEHLVPDHVVHDNPLAYSLRKGFLGRHEGELLFLSQYYPTMRRYGFDGTLIAEYDLGKIRDYGSRSAVNSDWATVFGTRNMVRSVNLFRAFSVTDQGVFVALQDEDSLVIDQLTHEGAFVERLEGAFVTSSWNNYVVDMIVGHPSPSQTRFTLLMNTPEPSIRAYLMKK